jgi:hypothetical protein
VLFFDGSKFDLEKSSGLREQRMTYNKKEKTNILQFIGLTNRNGWFVEAGTFAGGKAKESSLVWMLRLWEELEVEGEFQDGEEELFHVHCIVDRGFRDAKNEADEWNKKKQFIKLTVEIVEHLGTKENPNRVQHDPAEVEKNREIQAKRWCNEKAFMYFDISRFFSRCVRVSTLPMIESVKNVAIALANKRMKMEPFV